MGAEAATLLEKFAGARVLCVGDVMLDRYIYGEASRISPEAPVPVVHVKRRLLIPGGVGNVVENLAALGCTPLAVGVIGDDPAAATLTQFLTERNKACCDFVRDNTRPTIVKTRILAGIQQIVRYDEEETEPLEPAVEQQVLAKVDQVLDSVSAVAVSDYAKGMVTEKVMQGLIAMAEKRGIPVLVDPKGHDYSKYRGAFLVKPNRKELAEAVGVGAIKSEQQAAEAGRQLMQRYRIKNVLITLSERGMMLLTEDDAGREPAILPSKAREVFDVTGAGDTVLAGISAAMAVGAPLWLGARLATIAAGIVVGKVGTAVASPDEIRAAALME